MESIFPLLSLILPFAFLRLFWSIEAKSSSSFFLGLLSDLFLISQVMLLFSIFPENSSMIAFYICIGLMQSYLWFDFVLYRYFSINLRFSYVYFIKEMKSFIGSLSLRQAYEMVFFASICFGYNFLLYLFATLPLHTINGYYLSFLCIGLAVISIFVMRSFRKKDILHLLNPIIAEQLFFLKKLIFRKKNSSFESHLSSYVQNEAFQSFSKKYPFYRFTKGFYGEKQFEIDLSKEEKPHIIFVMLESFRAQNVGCITKSSKETKSPHFDQLAKDGILFNNCYSTGFYTNGALLSTFFGIYPPMEYPHLFQYRNSSIIGLSHLLKSRGYESSFFHNGFLNFGNIKAFLLNKNIDNLVDVTDLKKNYPEAKHSNWGIKDKYLIDYTIDYLQKAKSPQFLSMLTLDNHHPWVVKEKNLSDYQRYLQTFALTDQTINTFIQKLRSSDLAKKSLIFIFGDHGIDFIEEKYSMTRELKSSLLHVPLLILADGKIKKPCVIEDVVSHVDLMPTVMDLMQIQDWHHAMGCSLLRKKRNRPIFFHDHFSFSKKVGSIENNFKYAQSVDHKIKLSDLTSSFLQNRNIAFQRKDLATYFQDQVTKHQNVLISLYSKKNFSPISWQENVLKIDQNFSDQEMIELTTSKKNVWGLDLSYCKKITKKGFLKALKLCPDVQMLNFTECLWVSDDLLIQISLDCPKLSFLVISKCHLVTQKAIEVILSRCKHLNCLYMESMSSLSHLALNKPLMISEINLLDTPIVGSDLVSFFQACSYLHLCWLDCTYVSDLHLSQMKDSFQNLYTLYLSNAENISDEGLIPVFKKMKKLVIFRIKDAKISDQSLLILKEQSLHTLNFENCPNIKDEGLSYFWNKELKLIYLLSCKNITDRGMQGFLGQKELSITLQNCPKVSKEMCLALLDSGVNINNIKTFAKKLV